MRSGFTTQVVPSSQVDASSGTAIITSTEVLPGFTEPPTVSPSALDPFDGPISDAQVALDVAVQRYPEDEVLARLCHDLREHRLFTLS